MQKISCNGLDQVKMSPVRVHVFSKSSIAMSGWAKARFESFGWTLELLMALWREMPNNLSA